VIGAPRARHGRPSSRKRRYPPGRAPRSATCSSGWSVDRAELSGGAIYQLGRPHEQPVLQRAEPAGRCADPRSEEKVAHAVLPELVHPLIQDSTGLQNPLSYRAARERESQKLGPTAASDDRNDDRHTIRRRDRTPDQFVRGLQPAVRSSVVAPAPARR
jgi:hypothetical protein